MRSLSTISYLYRLAVLPLFIAMLLLPVVGLAEEKKPAPFIYDPKGKRDPFKVPLGVGLKEDSEALAEFGELKPVRVPDYLERFQLDSLKLVAILFQIEGQSSAAMFRDPEGKGHMVRIGQYIGVNEGQINQINDGEVVIVEPVSGQSKKSRTITLRLHKKDGQ
ncbi:MAG: pilus assembly protein PilP [Magnetococcales bacterium]|nr:pilus assembly protein PilP [Magnetococcales bacterium]